MHFYRQPNFGANGFVNILQVRIKWLGFGLSGSGLGEGVRVQVSVRVRAGVRVRGSGFKDCP